MITRDIIRQRRQAPQPSLSDAYLSGMPSKRRKVIELYLRLTHLSCLLHVLYSDAVFPAGRATLARLVCSSAKTMLNLDQMYLTLGLISLLS